MSGKVKIYDGVVIDMTTSEVISQGKVSYVDAKDVAYTKGGGTTTTTKTDPRIEQAAVDMLGSAKAQYNTGQLGGIAKINPLAQQAINQATGVASAQDTIAQQMAAAAAAGTNLSGMRTQAQTEAQKALGISQAGAGRAGGLGGSRQAINEQSIANDLASRFAGIDQQAQQMDLAQRQAAMGAQGAGLKTLGQVGQAQQTYNQQVADAPAKALQQYANVFGAGTKGFGQTKETSDGGK